MTVTSVHPPRNSDETSARKERIAQPVLFRVRAIPIEAFGDNHGRLTRKFVLLIIASHANQDGTKCYPGIPTLSKECGLCERSIQKVVSWLREHGFLQIAYKHGPKKTNMYTVLIPEMVNSSGHHELQRASCPELHGMVNGATRDGELWSSPNLPYRPTNRPTSRSSAGKIREEKKTPARRKNSSPKGKPSEVDPRFAEFKDLFWKYYVDQVRADPDWDGREGAALKNFLKANPDLTSEQWRRILDNRTASPVPHAERLSTWIGRAKNWLNGPTANKWGDPIIGGNTHARSTAQSKQAATVDAFNQVVAAIRGVDRGGTDKDRGPDRSRDQPGEASPDGGGVNPH